MKKENSRESVSLFEKKSLNLLKRKKTHLHGIVKQINWWEGWGEKEDKIWIPLSDIISIVPEPTAIKMSLEICPEVLDNVLEKFRVM